MKKTMKVAFGISLACLTAMVGMAWAGGPGGMGMGMGMGMGDNSSAGNMGMGTVGVTTQALPVSPFPMPVNPNILAGSYGGAGGMGMDNSGMQQGGMPMLDLRQVVMQGIQMLPQQQQYNGAIGMANQNLSMLNQSIGSGMSPVNQIRYNVRDQIMTNRVNDISRMGQATFRPMIQPGAVQSMISQIQPWNFPYRFQSAMMPAMIPMVSAPIKQQQMNFMQSGIMGQGFPNVRLPMPAFGPANYNNGGYNNGGMYPSYPNMMPGNQGMYNNSMPGNQGMYNGYGGGMIGPMSGMMGGMGGGMMGPMGGYGGAGSMGMGGMMGGMPGGMGMMGGNPYYGY